MFNLTSIIYSLIIPGLCFGVFLIIVSFFIPNILDKQKLGIQLLGIVLILFFTFYSGKYSENLVWKKKEAEQNVQIALLEATSNTTTTKVITEFVDKIVYVNKVKEKVVYVPNYVKTKTDPTCNILNYSVRVHNSAAKNEIPESTRIADEEPSGIRFSTYSETVNGNYTKCNEVREQLTALQKWVIEQQKVYNDTNVKLDKITSGN